MEPAREAGCRRDAPAGSLETSPWHLQGVMGSWLWGQPHLWDARANPGP